MLEQSGREALSVWLRQQAKLFDKKPVGEQRVFAGAFLESVLQRKETLRGIKAYLSAGGKATNSARILGILGDKNIPLLAFIGTGALGKRYEWLLSKAIKIHSVRTKPDEDTRVYVGLSSNPDVRLKTPGQNISTVEWAAFIKKYKALLAKSGVGQWVITGGSVAQGAIPEDVYAEFIRLAYAEGKDLRVSVDVHETWSDARVLSMLNECPTMLKFNLDEFQRVVDAVFPAEYEVLTLEPSQLSLIIERLAEKFNIEMVMLSLGGRGLIFAADGSAYHVFYDGKVDVKSTIGAGDSLTAGFLHYLNTAIPLQEALGYTVAVATLAVRSTPDELAVFSPVEFKARVNAVRKDVTIRVLSTHKQPVNHSPFVKAKVLRPISIVLNPSIDLTLEYQATPAAPQATSFKPEEEILRKIFASLGFDSFTSSTFAECIGERIEFGLTILKFKLNKAIERANLTQGIDLLVNEMINTQSELEEFEFEVLYNDKGIPIAIFPALTYQVRKMGLEKARLRYFDLGPYYFDIKASQPKSPQAKKNWEFLRRQKAAELESIGRYKEAAFGSAWARLIDPIDRKSPYVYVAIDQAGNLKTREIDLGNPVIPDYDSQKKQIIIPVLPTVITPGQYYHEDNFEYFRNIYNAAINDGEEVLVVGPGSGVDAWVASFKSRKTVYAVGINPLEILNTQLTAQIGGFSVEGIVADNIVSEDLIPRIPDKRFDWIFWNMPAYSGASFSPELVFWRTPAYQGGPYRYSEYWDGDYKGRILRGFAEGLHSVLKPNGQAVIWNRAMYIREMLEEHIVEEILRNYGLEVLQVACANYRIALPKVPQTRVIKFIEEIQAGTETGKGFLQALEEVYGWEGIDCSYGAAVFSLLLHDKFQELGYEVPISSQGVYRIQLVNIEVSSYSAAVWPHYALVVYWAGEPVFYIDPTFSRFFGSGQRSYDILVASIHSVERAKLQRIFNERRIAATIARVNLGQAWQPAGFNTAQMQALVSRDVNMSRVMEIMRIALPK
ncbi:MAG: PfkB family carbohydrate kinase [bacterium]